MKLGIDVGYGNTKISTANTDWSFPSVYIETKEKPQNSAGKEYIRISLDGKDYYVGRYAVNQEGNVEFDRNDILRHKLFMLAGICCANGKECDVALGLPIGDMDSMEDKLKNLTGNYDIIFNGQKRKITVNSISVFPQGQSVIDELSVFDETIVDKVVGIVDVGQKTVDIAFYDGLVLNHRRTKSFTHLGCYFTYQDIASDFYRSTGQDIKPFKVKQYIDNGKIKQEISEPHFEKLANTIISELRGADWNFVELDELYLVGGGSVYVEKYIKKAIPCSRMHSCFAFANARSFLEKIRGNE